MSPRLPKTLYHYCSIDTFFNIVKNKSVWLSDVSKSNDSRELRWAIGQCDYYIFKAWVNYLNSIHEHKMWTLVSAEDFSRIEEIRKSVSYFNLRKTWSLCLSSKKDDLGQWRGYAEDGCGISIGFNAERLRNISLTLFENSETGQCLLQKIKYSPKDTRLFFENDAGLSQITPDKTPKEVISIIESACAYLSIFMPFFKNPTFSQEKEWRLAYTMELLDCKAGKIPDTSNLPPTFSFGNYATIPTKGTLVSHLELSFPSLKNVVTEIVLGPKCKLTPLDVRMFLMSTGLIDKIDDKKMKIHCSAASYR